jgi:hypothetical protein
LNGGFGANYRLNAFGFSALFLLLATAIHSKDKLTLPQEEKEEEREIQKEQKREQ